MNCNPIRRRRTGPGGSGGVPGEFRGRRFPGCFGGFRGDSRVSGWVPGLKKTKILNLE